MNILLIDGRDEFRSHLSAHLRRAGHQVQALSEPEPAFAWLENHRPDVVMVERGVLLRQGEPLLLAVAQQETPPAILLPPQPLRESGLGEVIGRMERVEGVRRQAEEARDLTIRLQIGELIVDQAKRRVIFRGRIIRLTPTQYRLLHCLACHAGQVVGYRELLRQVWGFDADEAEARDLLKAHIRQIRRKMGLDAKRAEYLQSVRGFGYMLIDPHEDELPRSSSK
ncbi:MAG: response regulator transcription factor [Chloroflexota bacterium]|nr:response regulator transcription factor [Chloroflexota bacterium]